MNIAFFGTPDFTVDFLETLKASGFCPRLVVTNPDAPRGRGMVLTSPLPKKWADENNVKVLQPTKLTEDFSAELAQTNWDLFVVIAYGKIIPEHIINLPRFGTINVHYSLLPQYRGATPVESAILNGDTITGVCIQQMAYTLDSGDILMQKTIAIDPDDTTPTLREKLNNEARAMLPKVLEGIFAGTIARHPQDETLASHCKKITKAMGELTLSDAGTTNYNKYRAYIGSIGTYFFKDEKRLKITKAHIEDERFVIDEVIPENSKKMNYKDFLRLEKKENSNQWE